MLQRLNVLANTYNYRFVETNFVYSHNTCLVLVILSEILALLTNLVNYREMCGGFSTQTNCCISK